MLRISQQQIRAFDAAALRQFLKKVETFLLQEVPDEMSRIDDVPGYVQAAYARAVRVGHKTERDLVRYILDELTEQSR